MKKLILMIVLIALSISAFTVLAAAENIGASIDGEAVDFTDASPFIKNGRTLVPVRAIAEAMNATVEWNGSEQKVTITKDSFNAVLKINEYKIVINEKVCSMDAKAIIVNNRTYIPARFLGYALGYSVEWDNENKVVNYSFTGEQNTSFENELDINAEYPLTQPGFRDGTTYHYKKGYGNVMIVNGDDGKPPYKDASGRWTGKYEGNIISWQFSPYNMIFDSKKFDIDLDHKTPEENLKNFAEVFGSIAVEDVEYVVSDGENSKNHIYLRLPFNGFECVADVGYADNRGNDDISENYHWAITTTNFPVDFSSYRYRSEFSKDPNDLAKGSKKNNPLEIGASKTLLMTLNQFLGEDGQRIWQMLYDYYNNAGLQYVAPGTFFDIWKEEGNPNKDVLSKQIVEKYGFTFVNSFFDKYGEPFLTIKTPNSQKEVLIIMGRTGPVDPYTYIAIQFN